MILIICILAFGLLASILMNLYYVIPYFRRPKCHNKYNCADCIHAKALWKDYEFRGIICRIKAR